MEGLDLGKVHSITTEGIIENSHQENVLWGKSVWEEKVNSSYKLVRITFEFWYRTKTAYNFQLNIRPCNYLVVPVTNEVFLTFYQVKASLEGKNPHVWHKSKEMPKLTLINK
jgi:hypothetical protein